jgi:hypothetical protein
MKLKIGIDIDHTITASKNSIKFFSLLTNLLSTDVEIYIITNREPGTEKEVVQELVKLGIKFNFIIITAKKAEYISKEGISIFFENEDENFLSIPETVLVLKVRERGNFSFSEKKWLSSKNNTKII